MTKVHPEIGFNSIRYNLKVEREYRSPDYRIGFNSIRYNLKILTR